MKIFDCFMYFDEELVLDVRFHHLYEYVDYFVIVESEFNHKGEKRDLNFKINNFSKFKDKITREERSPDEKFMKSIEEMIGVVGSARDGFRSDVTAFMFSKMRKGETVDYKSYGPLKEAVEGYLITSVKDISRIVTKSKSRDDDQKKKYSEMLITLIEEYGYNENSAEEILTYAANNLWRDS